MLPFAVSVSEIVKFISKALPKFLKHNLVIVIKKGGNKILIYFYNKKNNAIRYFLVTFWEKTRSAI